ncbi:MAG: hypothetical protein D6681_08900 [Calditrichaeota bacterium]|nr:MAG: hypothetical protein D6681_08900 [Calditrichota bacterium]
MNIRKHRKKLLHIVLIPDDKASPKELRIRYSTVALILLVLGIFFVSGVLGIVSYSLKLQQDLEKERLVQENQQLRQQVAKIAELQAELEKLKAYYERVRNSLQGYIQFADKVDQELLSPEKLAWYGMGQSSIFTTVPLKAPVIGFISQEFKRASHNGIDIVASEGTPILAAADGIVVFSGWSYENGYEVILWHPGNYLTFYWHNARNLVIPGQMVKQGEVIAFLGNSGETSSGPHVHFEIWKEGQPVNPREYVQDLNKGE